MQSDVHTLESRSLIELVLVRPVTRSSSSTAQTSIAASWEGAQKQQKQQQQPYRVACPRVHGRHATVAASLPTALQLQLDGNSNNNNNKQRMSKKFLKLGIVRHVCELNIHTNTQDMAVCVCVSMLVCVRFV